MAQHLEGQPPEAFRAFVEQFAAFLARWLHERRQGRDEPDPLLELSQLRVLADLFVQNREKPTKVLRKLESVWCPLSMPGGSGLSKSTTTRPNPSNFLGQIQGGWLERLRREH